MAPRARAAAFRGVVVNGGATVRGGTPRCVGERTRRSRERYRAGGGARSAMGRPDESPFAIPYGASVFASSPVPRGARVAARGGCELCVDHAPDHSVLAGREATRGGSGWRWGRGSRQALETVPCQHPLLRGQLHGRLLSWDLRQELIWPYPAAALLSGGAVRGSGLGRLQEQGRVLCFLALAGLFVWHPERPIWWESAPLAPCVSPVTCRSRSCTFRRQCCMPAAFLRRLQDSTYEGLCSPCRGGLPSKQAVAPSTYRRLFSPR